jgi:hypothetical protein
MNNYIKVLVISLLLLIVSIINEKHVQIYLNSTPKIENYIYIYTLRYIHITILVYSSLYLFLFNGIGTEFDIRIYLILMLVITLAWYIFDACWISYFELLFYNVNLKNVVTTFHSTVYPLANKYSSSIMLLLCRCSFFTTTILLYYSKKIKRIYKIIYYVIFLYLSIDSFLKSRVNTLYYDSTKNKQLAIFDKIYSGFFR